MSGKYVYGPLVLSVLCCPGCRGTPEESTEVGYFFADVLATMTRLGWASLLILVGVAMLIATLLQIRARALSDKVYQAERAKMGVRPGGGAGAAWGAVWLVLGLCCITRALGFSPHWALVAAIYVTWFLEALIAAAWKRSLLPKA